jgi:hypothetical protein
MMFRCAFIFLFAVHSALIAQTRLKVDESKKSFGTVQQRDPVVLSYQVTNAGDQPAVFERYEVTCSCTSATLPAVPLLPGKTAEISVSFKTDAAIGLQDRVVKVFSNDGKGPLKLRFNGVVQEK